MKKLYFLSLITLAIMVAVHPQHTKAQTPIWDGSYAPWTHGSGTQADPYLIEHPWHLAWLAHQVNDSAYTYNGQYFRLTTDLDMNSIEWTPIGNSTTNCFRGNFDGDGHLIDNIKITATGSVGLFYVISNASIMNLGVNTTITTYTSSISDFISGGIVAIVKGSNNSISNCYHTGNITHSGSYGGYNGGIIGYADGEITLSNCHNYGNIKDDAWRTNQNAYSSCESWSGGLIGIAKATVILTDCSNNGKVEGKFGEGNGYHFGSYTGGLIGRCQSGIIVTVINSYNNGNITGEYSGGLVGSISESQLNISNSYNTGTLLGEEQGGLVGSNSGNCTIMNSYNAGSLSNGRFIQGGLIGGTGGSISISHCYNTGIIIAEYAGSPHQCGGIIGYSAGMTNITCSANIGNVIINAGASSSYSVQCGGIIGSANNPITLDRCYNTAAVSGIGTSTNTSRYVGGLVGYLTASANNIHECYNTGAVSTGTNATYNKCGGILGYNNGGTSITNCYNVGTLSGGSPKGIADYNSNYIPTISNCYYLESCGGSSQTGAQAASVTLMKSPSFPYMLNNGVQAFTVDGNPNVNQGYPIFGDMVYAVSTQNATNVGVTRVTLNGNYVGGADTVGFQYRENTTGSAWNTVYASVGSPVSYLLTGLQSNTSYVFRFMAINNGGAYYGEEKTFTTGTCNLTASVSPSSVTLCQGEVATVTASGQSSMGSQFSYSWNTGETTPAISMLGGGERVVTVSDSNGCTATASVNVTVHPLPNVAISGNTTLCAGASNTLTASGGNSYLWNTGANTPSITVNSDGTYSVTATNSYGCNSSASVSVTSIENVTISGNLNLCQGQGTTLYANGTGTYQWNTGTNTPSITVTQAGPYSVTVSGGGCTSNASVTVSVAPNPTPTILGNTVICQNETTTLTANGGNSYSWSNGITGNSISVSQSGTYMVTATNVQGCTATASTYVTVNPLPNVNISGNSSFCQGDYVTLTATGANTYVWGNSSTNAAITVTNAGSYTVTGTDANGCSNIATKTVAVNPTYNIPLTHSICQGESYNFYGQNLTAAGTYTHTLQTVNGCDSVLTLTLMVKALPTPTLTGNTSLCEGETTTLIANGGVSYVWNNASTGNSISVSQSGVYTVTATNAEGCSATASVTATVNPLPNVNINGNNSFCQGDNITLTATGASTYVWNNTSTNTAITVSSAGTYTVTGTDANGCSNIATKTVSVNPTYNVPLTHSICQGESYNFYGQNLTTAGTYTHTLQTVNGCDSVLTLSLSVKALPTPTITGNTSLCEGETTTLTANGGVSYAWSNAATANSINVSQSGVYTVTATNAEGCSAPASVTVTVNPLPTITISGNTTLCAGNSTTLTASGADSYSWSTGDNTASVSISAFGIYTVTGTTTAGCSGTANVTVLVSQLPVITISGETDICAGESTTLTANGGETYLWNDGTTGNTLTVNLAGTYQVIGYNAAGCYSIADATVSVWQPATSEFTVSCPDSCYIWNGESYCQSGDYTQTLQTIHGCDSVVTLHLSITVGIDDHNLAASMTVYPNPTTSVINVQFTMNNVQAETMEIRLYDAYGKLLNVVAANNDETVQIDLSAFAPGIYFIKAVTEGNVVAVRKVVKQ